MKLKCMREEKGSKSFDDEFLCVLQYVPTKAKLDKMNHFLPFCNRQCFVALKRIVGHLSLFRNFALAKVVALIKSIGIIIKSLGSHEVNESRPSYHLVYKLNDLYICVDSSK